MKWNEQKYCTGKKNCIDKIWDSRLEKMHCHTGTSRRHRNYEQGEKQNINVKVYMKMWQNLKIWSLKVNETEDVYD